MAHVIFGFYGHETAHTKLKTELNNWRYEREGTLRKGTTAPIISEIKFYDVRIPKEHVEDFIRDLRPHLLDEQELTHDPNARVMIRTMTWGIKLLRKSFGLKGAKVSKEPQRYKLSTSWYYAFLAGVLPDPEQEDPILKTKKEVL